MQLEIDIAQEARSKTVRALDLSAVAAKDLANLLLQRSEVMFDIPKSGQVIRAWEAGDAGPIEQVVETLGDEIARRVAGLIHAEYRALEPQLKKLNPKRIADIGCGYAFFDLFAVADLKCDVLLIDLEENERRHFGFKQAGAAYSSLAVARQLLEDNGIPTSMITTLNPREAAPEGAGPVDLVVSFLSCGFHYPVDLYLPFLKNALNPGGSAIFDLRKATAKPQSASLRSFGELTRMDGPPKTHRVLMKKAA